MCVQPAIIYKYFPGKDTLKTFSAHRELFGKISLQVFALSQDISRVSVLAVLYALSTRNINSERT